MYCLRVGIVYCMLVSMCLTNEHQCEAVASQFWNRDVLQYRYDSVEPFPYSKAGALFSNYTGKAARKLYYLIYQ